MPEDAVHAPNNTMRRAERARRAKDTVNHAIPDILRVSPRARHGIHKADRVVDPPQNVPSGDITPSTAPRIRVQCCDTLEAASRVSERPAASRRATATVKTPRNTTPNATILNFASALKPGGGFLEGANSQEEFICARTTLYASLWDDFYRLPDLGGVHTPDVMVFRDCTPEANDLDKRDRFFVDVISAGMLRFPDARGRAEERADGACTCGITYCDRDRDLVTRKMKAVMRIAQSKATRTLILGAWGCGAYGNPVKEVAKLWRKVIVGSPRQRKPNVERWEGIRDIVFAIPDRRIAREFQDAFGDVLATDGPPSKPTASVSTRVVDDVRSDNVESGHLDELISKISETELQIEQASNPRRRAVLREVLAGLNKDLARGLAAKAFQSDDLTREEDEEEEDGDEDEEGYVVSGFPGSDGEENSFYNFDENDVPSDSSDCAAEEVFEFRAQKLPQLQIATSNNNYSHPASVTATTNNDNNNTDIPNEPSSIPGGEGQDDTDFALIPRTSHGHSRTTSSASSVVSPHFDAKTGWYSGSIDQFHAFIKRSVQHTGHSTAGTPGGGHEAGIIGMSEMARLEEVFGVET